MANIAQHENHVQPTSLYLRTFLTLTALMLLTIGAAQLPNIIHLDSAPGTVLMNCIAMGIATIKAILVIQIFMGVKFSSKLAQLFAILGFVWFSLMFMTFADYMTRKYEPIKGWEQKAPNAFPRQATDDDVEAKDVGKQSPN